MSQRTKPTHHQHFDVLKAQLRSRLNIRQLEREVALASRSIESNHPTSHTLTGVELLFKN
jgi:hypothetical protein